MVGRFVGEEKLLLSPGPRSVNPSRVRLFIKNAPCELKIIQVGLVAFSSFLPRILKAVPVVLEGEVIRSTCVFKYVSETVFLYTIVVTEIAPLCKNTV